MASAVFGTPVTDAVLKEMPEYQAKCSISQQDRARVALEQRNAGDKAISARQFLEKLQGRFEGGGLSTMCLIYNATGATTTAINLIDYQGHLCESAYPVIIANGQWGAFLHGQYPGSDNFSNCCLAYSAINNKGIKKDWIIGFSNNRATTNKVYSEIRNPGLDWSLDATWRTYGELIDGNNYKVHTKNESRGYLVACIGDTVKTVIEAIMTLPEAI